MKNFLKTSKKGFTLTEILVVVLVIAVLAAIAYPMYTKAITKSKAVEAINLLQMVRNKQLQNFAKNGKYMEDLSKIGNLTIDPEQQKNLSDGTIKINDYTVSLNSVKNCMTATYQKGNTNFSFSTSYETPGLGCTGSICSSFGDIVGTASSVCNCGTKTCTNNFELNPNTCACECNQCLSGGYCMAPTQTQSENRMCPDGKSMQSRTCTASCGGGDCGEWSPSSCPAIKTPCPSNCQAGYKRDTSVSYSEDGACCVAKTACPSSCGAGYKRDTNISYSDDGACCVAVSKTPCPSSCQAGYKRDSSVSYSEDGSCCVAETKTPCAATCQAGYKRDTNVSYSEDGSCCVAKTACPATCAAGEERNTTIKYSEDGACCVSKSCNSSEVSLCSSTAGSWNNSDCSCNCTSPKVWNSATGCACPAATPYFYNGSCNKCKSEEVQSNGMCCPKGYVSRDGQKCVVDIKPKRQTINVLANCHEDNAVGWNGQPPASCRVTKKGYFIGGSLPYVASTVKNHSYGVWPFKKKCKDGAEAHTSSYYGGTWWNGGTQVYPAGLCSYYGGTDQQVCDKNCTSKPCSFVCLVSENVPSTCPSYYHYYSFYGRCEGYLDRTDCDNTKGSAVVLTCE